MRLASQQLGSYIFQEHLGRSSTSELWRAYDARLQRPVTVKFLLTATHEGSDSQLSFQYEADRLVSLHHSAIASCYEARLLAPMYAETACAYVVREYVQGRTLADYLRTTSSFRKAPAASSLVHLFATMSLALDYAHQQGIIHGGLKPGNVLLRQPSSSDGEIEPIITDFGMCRLLKVASNAPLRRSLDALLYLSPEQAKGLPEQKEGDLYALGVLLYEICTGAPPFQGNRPVAILTQQVNAQPTPPNLINPHLSPALTQVIMHSLAKEPEARFQSAASMTVALAEALHVPLSELPSSLSQRGERELAKQKEYIAHLSSSTAARLVTAARSMQNEMAVGAAFKRSGMMRSVLPFSAQRKLRQRQQVVLIICAALILVTLITSGLGTFALLHHTPSPPSQPLVVGHAFFVSSGQFNEDSNTQGINDELQIDLSGLAAPGQGYSYYAWLLPDTIQTEAPPILLGMLPVQKGQVHFLYVGGKSHLNLLSVTSRFLITRESSSVLPTVPSLDTNQWSYYAEIPQAASPADALHFSMLSHFRHLLVESPELQARGLHGGLVLWLAQLTQRVQDLSNGAREAWQAKDMAVTRKQLISLLDVLDGKDLARTDLPAKTPLLADPRSDQIPLLGLKPKNADPPGYSYGDDVPPGYVYLISLHLSGALLSSEATPEQRTHATQINAALDTVDHWLAQAHDDAKHLVLLTPAQLAQPASLTFLNDLVAQTKAAYAGQINTSTGQSQGGVLWISSNIERLVDFVVTPYAHAHS